MIVQQSHFTTNQAGLLPPHQSLIQHGQPQPNSKILHILKIAYSLWYADFYHTHCHF